MSQSPIGAAEEDQRLAFEVLGARDLADEDSMISAFDNLADGALEGGDAARQHRHSQVSPAPFYAVEPVTFAPREADAEVPLILRQDIDSEVCGGTELGEQGAAIVHAYQHQGRGARYRGERIDGHA